MVSIQQGDIIRDGDLDVSVDQILRERDPIVMISNALGAIVYGFEKEHDAIRNEYILAQVHPELEVRRMSPLTLAPASDDEGDDSSVPPPPLYLYRAKLHAGPVVRYMDMASVERSDFESIVSSISMIVVKLLSVGFYPMDVKQFIEYMIVQDPKHVWMYETWTAVPVVDVSNNDRVLADLEREISHLWAMYRAARPDRVDTAKQQRVPEDTFDELYDDSILTAPSTESPLPPNKSASINRVRRGASQDSPRSVKTKRSSGLGILPQIQSGIGRMRKGLHNRFHHSDHPHYTPPKQGVNGPAQRNSNRMQPRNNGNYSNAVVPVRGNNSTEAVVPVRGNNSTEAVQPTMSAARVVARSFTTEDDGSGGARHYVVEALQQNYINGQMVDTQHYKVVDGEVVADERRQLSPRGGCLHAIGHDRRQHYQGEQQQQQCRLMRKREPLPIEYSDEEQYNTSSTHMNPHYLAEYGDVQHSDDIVDEAI
jgi:hypothetical protein